MFRFAIIAICSFLLDQLTKWWIDQNIPYPSYPRQVEDAVIEPSIEVIHNFFYIVHIGNKGAAWGMFEGYGIVLGTLGVLATIAIILFRNYLELHKFIPGTCFGLMVGGILGNVVDRFLHGHVIDFLDVWLPGYRWPAFNIADSAIVVGVSVYLCYSFRQDYLAEKKENQAAS